MILQTGQQPAVFLDCSNTARSAGLQVGRGGVETCLRSRSIFIDTKSQENGDGLGAYYYGKASKCFLALNDESFRNLFCFAGSSTCREQNEYRVLRKGNELEEVSNEIRSTRCPRSVYPRRDDRQLLQIFPIGEFLTQQLCNSPKTMYTEIRFKFGIDPFDALHKRCGRSSLIALTKFHPWMYSSP